MRDTIAGRFELLTPIAEGGSGAVWRAQDLRLGRECAAKVLRQRDSADLLRFVREQSVNLEHPHVVAPYGWAAEDEHVAIAMELVSGGTLEAALQDNGAVADWVAEELVCQLLSALRFVHTRGWVHRDVKPANVLLEPTGSALPVARLADFGIAVRLTDARLTHTGTVVGTPGYLPDEAYAPGSPSRTMDLYAAGVTAVRMVLPEADLSDGPLRPEDVTRLGLFEGSPVLRAGAAGLLSADPAARTAAADRLLTDLMATAPARAGRQCETADGEPFEVFDVLEPTTERELSPVADAARLPSRAGRTADAPIAWHAVHRQAIARPGSPAMAQRGGDLLRPFAPATGGTPGDDAGAGPAGGVVGGDVLGGAAPRAAGGDRAGERRGAPEPLDPGTSASPSAPEDSTERLDPSAAPEIPGFASPAAGRGDTTAVLAAALGGTGGPLVATPAAAHRDEVGDASGSVAPEPGRSTRHRRARWPWWLLALTLAVLALVAGYVWLGPMIAGWSGNGGTNRPAPTAPPPPTSSPVSSPGPTEEPAPATDVTPVCTELADGTVSCVVTP
ncbi:protein kinase domain-containing protein [Kocuria tytonis]|uniref:Serine/threonine protein kinase n=1 Tax=Kocuria tytonis TaxID=2054280 RepID=A0A495A8H0_9MICC|nr:serine/threonine-protein kinase [Kocuria tytonis]RKQ36277.1 serine/threonine protein kinase [Kocuria tytonis]